ncbi:MAG: hypothetical protein GY865_07325 [candidate division Zixibacteria bacterium]|nr:hypothetical protein [candidate division Zixibacteria bacterium]
MKKKILAVLCILMLCVAIIPVPVLAGQAEYCYGVASQAQGVYNQILAFVDCYYGGSTNYEW